MRLPNSYGSVVKLSGNRRKPYAIRKTVGWDMVNGKARQKFRYIDYFTTYSEALIALAKFNEKNIDITKIDLTFADLFNEWSFKARKSESTMAAKNSTYRSHLEGTIGNERIKDIDDKMLQNVLDNCDKGYSTKSQIKQIMRDVIELAIARGIRADNPTTLLDAGKQEESTKHTDISLEDAEILKKCADAKTIVLLMYTGMRADELLGIRLEDIHLEERYMVGGNKSDAGKRRQIPIHKSQAEFIRQQMVGKKEYLYEEKGKQMKYRYLKYHLFDKVLDSLGMNYTPHDCRHTFVTRMREAGVPLLVVKKIVGHKPDSVTEKVYTHISLEEKIASVDKLV